MISRTAWIWIAALLTWAAAAGAQPPRKDAPIEQAPAREYPHEHTHPVRPHTMDRHLPPDDFSTNVVKVLRTTNKAQTTSYVPIVYTLKHVNPFSVLRFMRRPVQAEEGLIFTFVNQEGTGGKVLFCVPQYMIPSLTALVEKIDRPELTTSDGTERIYRQLRHRRADPSDPDFLAAAASLLTGDDSDVIADPETNALFFEDAPSGSKNLDEALTNYLDVPTAMVQLIVKVYEIDVTNDTQIGMDYLAWQNDPGANLFAVGAFAEHGSFPRAERPVFQPGATGALGLPKRNFTANGYNYAYEFVVPSAFFDFLTVKNKARVLSKMKLAALNTYPAKLTAGQQILYYSVQVEDPEKDGVRDSGRPMQGTNSRVVVGTTNRLEDGELVPVETGVELSILPTIGYPDEEGPASIKLDLEIEWSDFTGYDDTGVPLINRRHLATTLRSLLDDEILIGGIRRQAKVRGTNKAPILGSIPVLGYLFGGENNANRQTEVVVAIEPVGVTRFDIARDYVIAERDGRVMEMATGERVEVDMPETSFGFNQLGLDPEYGLKNPDIVPYDEPVDLGPASLPAVPEAN